MALSLSVCSVSFQSSGAQSSEQTAGFFIAGFFIAFLPACPLHTTPPAPCSSLNFPTRQQASFTPLTNDGMGCSCVLCAQTCSTACTM
jgi:hypothetical protein